MTEPDIITTAAWKGGVGKTTLAYELAYQMGAVLADWDWDKGGATVAWGYRHETRVRAPLLDALERGKTPTPLRGNRKPDLIPSHPDFGVNQPEPDAGATALEKWAADLGRRILVDTHPGGCDSTYSALRAARVVVTPAVLATKELSALEGMIEELADYPLLVIPYMVPSVPPGREITRLRQIVARHHIPVGPMVSNYSWIPRRQLRMAIASGDPLPARVKPFAEQIRKVAEAVTSYGV